MSYKKSQEKHYQPPSSGEKGKPPAFSGHKDFEKQLVEKSSEAMLKDNKPKES